MVQKDTPVLEQDKLSVERQKMKKEALLFLSVLLCSLAWGQTIPLEASVKQHNNRPTIFLNNQPVSPQFMR
jgi:hypothetical protein